MNWVDTIKTKDWLVAATSLLAPFVAISISQYLDKKRRLRDEQVDVFKTLMATRANIFDQRHIEALNMIDVVFHDTSLQHTKIRRCWKKYLNHLNSKGSSKVVWEAKRSELLIELLAIMGLSLGFDLDKTKIQSQVHPLQDAPDNMLKKHLLKKSLVDMLSRK